MEKSLIRRTSFGFTIPGIYFDVSFFNRLRNGEGNYYCPISLKTFSDASHLVAIATTGNVYSFESVDKFNIQVCKNKANIYLWQAKHWKDLLTDEPFTRKDIITIQVSFSLCQLIF
jgi:hypothetical protein